MSLMCLSLGGASSLKRFQGQPWLGFLCVP
jgi:hypothetical protein